MMTYPGFNEPGVGSPTFQQFFKWGLDRGIPELLAPPAGYPHLNLGPGDSKIILGTIGVGRHWDKLTDKPWDATKDELPFPTNSVGAIHAHQFMEHFDYEVAIWILKESERVLVPGGVMFITTPYPGHGHFTQALDHKTMWTEETWQWLFSNDYYNPSGKSWDLEVHACYMAGVVYRNLDLFTQLVKR